MLGIAPFESDPESIRQAGIRRTAHVRKFCLGPRAADATRLLGELANAFACLADPERKRAYDESLRPGALAAAVEDPQPELAKSAPPFVVRPILVRKRCAGETGDEAMPNDAAAHRRPQFARQVGASYWSFRWASRKRSRRQAAIRKTALLMACCALLTVAIVVAARAKSLLPDQAASTAPAAVATESTSDDLPKPPPMAPLRPVSKPRLPETASDLVSEAPEAVSPSPEPAPEQESEEPPQVARFDPPAASNSNRAPAAPVSEEPEGGAAAPAAADANAKKKLIEDGQDELALEKLHLGVDALNEPNLIVAIRNFSEAILATDYRDTDVTNKAAGLLNKALGDLRDKGIHPGQVVREALDVQREFRSRIEHTPHVSARKR
ncbi:MAG TPA: hypothetical protein VN699_05945 [Pirellulales bacterium]|nr:hypothetical protein [Pirellulales bacterium]